MGNDEHTSGETGKSRRNAETRFAFGSGLSGERPSAVAATEAAERALAELMIEGGGVPTAASVVGGLTGADSGERAVRDQGEKPSIEAAVVFVSPHHMNSMGEVMEAVAKVLSPKAMIGVGVEAVIGGFLELEGVPGVSVLAMHLPGVEARTFSSEDLPMVLGVDEEADAAEDIGRVAVPMGLTEGHLFTVLMADPFTVPIAGVLPTVTRASKGLGVVVGGIVSGSMRAGGNVLAEGTKVRHQGLVGLTLRRKPGVPWANMKGLRVECVVSQGCAPVGRDLIVTGVGPGLGHGEGMDIPVGGDEDRSEGDAEPKTPAHAGSAIITGLGGRPALEVIREVIESLPEQKRALLSRGLLIGRVVNEYKERFGAGDYLVRAVVKVAPEGGAVMTDGLFKVGQTVRLHLRDAETADADLSMLMDTQALHGRPLGGLLITCNGRGTRLFKAPSHDAVMIQRAFFESVPGEEKAKTGSALGGSTAAVFSSVVSAGKGAEQAPATTGGRGLRRGFPLAGCFAAGEIGPVNDSSDRESSGVHLHGHTACAVLFREEE